MKRKSPIRHTVQAHSRKGRSVRSFIRGKGERKFTHKLRVNQSETQKRIIEVIRKHIAKHPMIPQVPVYELFRDVPLNEKTVAQVIELEKQYRLGFLRGYMSMITAPRRLQLDRKIHKGHLRERGLDRKSIELLRKWDKEYRKQHPRMQVYQMTPVYIWWKK